VNLKQIGTFGARDTPIDNLQLFRGEIDSHAASMLASCPVVAVACGERIDDGSRERLFIVLSGQLQIGPTHTSATTVPAAAFSR
jgi:hypothetical protein